MDCIHSALRFGLSFTSIRTIFNRAYNKLSAAEKSDYHSKYWNLFRGHQTEWSGRWELEIGKRTIYLPLQGERMWLDWDHGISLLGHDMEIKNFYANLLRSAERPDVFFDVGANYGTHSLLFSCLGVPSFTFEPNATCHPVFKEMCALNSVEPQIEHVAIAATAGTLELRYPEKFTWLGSVRGDVSRELGKQYELLCERVAAFPLDRYQELLAGKRALIKVDTEGNELEVFRGASRIMSEARPIIVFESNHDATDRKDIGNLLDGYEYEIYGLQMIHSPKKLGAQNFVGAKETNFAAWPKERSMLADYDTSICFDEEPDHRGSR